MPIRDVAELPALLVVCADIHEHGFVELVKQHAELSVELKFVDSTQAGFASTLADADCLLVGGETVVNAQTLAVANDLKLIQVPQVGYDGIDLAAAREHGVPVCNAPGANAAAVAEHAFMLVLATMRLVCEYDERVRQGDWAMMDFFDRNLGDFVGATLGIIGFGEIGRKLASFSRPMAGEILYYQRRKAEKHVEAKVGARYVRLEELLRQSDAVSLHVPLTDSTRGMIGSRELGWMKETAVLVNTARGAIIDESALIAVLSEGRLRGAALDVFSEEPLAPPNPLLDLPNVLLTPHMAGGSRSAVAKSFELAFDNIRRLRNGQHLLHRVDGQ